MKPPEIDVRAEEPPDFQAVAEINELAFDRPTEAQIVAAVRDQNAATVSLVATIAARVVGHILFSPVTIDGCTLLGLGLAPMAVLPTDQRGGVGTRLVRAGLERCRRLGVAFVVVLGHPDYYPRFGFARASGFGLEFEQSVPDEAFMAIELIPDSLEGISGVVRYLPMIMNA